ncbi:hypothetical protein DF16_pBMB293orf00203 (plasmid) [Bacillus thuringiensis serovar kurstaki str. YBT-1520]|nr:hypothetical protein H175_285p273 [Bacillus thuringiensis serovar thuringiensis str. IS5056]AIM34727.1 hypothetical protein DF16_pBMB293orf00203 [Bacillus thuringiensis serovar kurstaki str. YBT-1520]
MNIRKLIRLTTNLNVTAIEGLKMKDMLQSIYLRKNDTDNGRGMFTLF